MATGSATYAQIVVSAEPRGRFEGAYFSGVLYPGTVVEVTNAAPVSGRYTYAAAVANFGALAIVVEDRGQGRTVDTPYASGEYGQIYFPLPGDDLLLRAINATYAIGDILSIGSGGLVQVSTGTLGPQPFQSFDTATIGSGPYLLLSKYAGH